MWVTDTSKLWSDWGPLIIPHLREKYAGWKLQIHHDEVNVVRRLLVCHTTVMSGHLGWNAKWGGGQNIKLSKYLLPWCCWALIASICKFVDNLDNFVQGMNTRWLHWLPLGKMETQYQHNKSLLPLHRYKKKTSKKHDVFIQDSKMMDRGTQSKAQVVIPWYLKLS